MPTVNQKAIGGISSDLTSYSARVCVPPYSQSLGHLADLESHRCCLCAAIFTKLGNHQLAYNHLKFFRKKSDYFYGKTLLDRSNNRGRNEYARCKPHNNISQIESGI